jgi:hypothetical protein
MHDGGLGGAVVFVGLRDLAGIGIAVHGRLLMME